MNSVKFYSRSTVVCSQELEGTLGKAGVTRKWQLAKKGEEHLSSEGLSYSDGFLSYFVLCWKVLLAPQMLHPPTQSMCLE